MKYVGQSIERVDAIRLLKIRSHLGEELIGRNSDVYGKSEAFMNLILQFMCKNHQVSV